MDAARPQRTWVVIVKGRSEISNWVQVQDDKRRKLSGSSWKYTFPRFPNLWMKITNKLTFEHQLGIKSGTRQESPPSRGWELGTSTTLSLSRQMTTDPDCPSELCSGWMMVVLFCLQRCLGRNLMLERMHRTLQSLLRALVLRKSQPRSAAITLANPSLSASFVDLMQLIFSNYNT